MCCAHPNDRGHLNTYELFFNISEQVYSHSKSQKKRFAVSLM
ncbi:Uncharacterised protein [Serratia fonticola]|nr:Uncharacterised protein [Serratia fonticola]